MTPKAHALPRIRRGLRTLAGAPDRLRGLDRDLRLLLAVVLIVGGALALSFVTIRQAERSLLRAEANSTAVHWAEFLQTRLRGLDEILAAGLVSERDQRVLDFAAAAGAVQDYQVIRPDGRVALSNWAGDFRGAVQQDVISTVVEGERTVSKVVEEDLAGERVVVGQAYVPLAAGTGQRGALKVDVDVTRQAVQYRRLGTAAFVALIALLAPPAGVAGVLVARNIRTRRRGERLQEQRGTILEQLAKGADVNDVMRRIAAYVEGHRPGATCTICTLDPPGERVVAAVSSARRETGVALAGRSVDAVPAPFADGLRASAPTWLTAADGGVWSVPFYSMTGIRMGALILENVAGRSQPEADGPEAALAQLAGLALESRRAEDELAELRRRNELILGAAGDGILGVDADGRITFANPAAARMLGRDARAMIGTAAANLLAPPPDAMEDGEPVAELLAGDAARQIEKAWIGSVAGEALPVQMVVTPVPRGLSSLRGVIVFHDISPQIAAQRSLQLAKEEAETASRSKSSFLAHMSHELRTPLNAIIGFSEVMATESLGRIAPAHYRDYAGHIHSSGQHLLELINDLLDLSKIEAGRLELWEETVDLANLFERCRLLVAESAQKRGVVLDVRDPTEVGTVYGDERKLKQVLVNLLSNAVKFTPAGGRILVEATSDGAAGIEIRVSDTGVGIALMDMEKVLAPFGQVDERLNRDHQGTGLGLPLAKALVELHGGHLDLESTPGRGTTVTVRLPERGVAPSGRASSTSSDATTVAAS